MVVCVWGGGEGAGVRLYMISFRMYMYRPLLFESYFYVDLAFYPLKQAFLFSIKHSATPLAVTCSRHSEMICRC